MTGGEELWGNICWSSVHIFHLSSIWFSLVEWAVYWVHNKYSQKSCIHVSYDFIRQINHRTLIRSRKWEYPPKISCLSGIFDYVLVATNLLAQKLRNFLLNYGFCEMGKSKFPFFAYSDFNFCRIPGLPKTLSSVPSVPVSYTHLTLPTIYSV